MPKNNATQISSEELKNIADQAKEELENTLIEEPSNVTEEDTVINSNTEDLSFEETITEDAPIFIGGKTKSKTKKSVETNNNEPYTGVTDDELKYMMPDIAEGNVTLYDTKSKELLADIEKYRKNLIINEGLTTEEADTAARARLNKSSQKINNEYLEENPNTAIIEIKKENSSQLGLTEEEHEKLLRVKEIKLVLKETKELESLPVKKIQSKFKSKFIKDIEGAISRYSIPLPVMGDLVTFKGAPTIQMISAVETEDDTPVEMIRKKASFIYDRMIGGVVYDKYKEDGTLKLTYDDFINTFKFHDMDMAMYGIICASTAEETETEFGCSKCNTNFDYKYNMKALLDTSSITGIFKQALFDIEANKHKPEEMRKMLEDSNTSLMFRSTETHNAYQVSFPSIGKVEKIMSMVNQEDPISLYFSTIAVFIDKLLIYDSTDESYVEIDGNEETDILLEILPEIPEVDLNTLNVKVQEIMFIPKFVMNSTCPNCGNVMKNEFSISQLVFLRAQDMSEVIK